jgi:hypothetical protein
MNMNLKTTTVSTTCTFAVTAAHTRCKPAKEGINIQYLISQLNLAMIFSLCEWNMVKNTTEIPGDRTRWGLMN